MDAIGCQTVQSPHQNDYHNSRSQRVDASLLLTAVRGWLLGTIRSHAV